jgi:SAM-dependent methyltransferase
MEIVKQFLEISREPLLFPEEIQTRRQRRVSQARAGQSPTLFVWGEIKAPRRLSGPGSAASRSGTVPRNLMHRTGICPLQSNNAPSWSSKDRGSAAMSDMNRSFAGSMPAFYDRFLVPVMFEPFARDLASRLQGLKSGRLLELAAGTGIVTRAMVESLPLAVHITATDLNAAMLEQAKSHAGLDRVIWREADALSLPFSDRVFDCTVCQFGVMFFPDKVAGFREAFRVLRPGGRLMFNVWGDREGTVQQLAGLEVGRLLSRDPATLLAPEYNDVETAKAELATAGLGSIIAENVVKTSHFQSPRDAAISSCHGGLLRAQIERHAPDRLDEITDRTTAVIAARYGNGQIDAPLRAIVFTAQRPVG